MWLVYLSPYHPCFTTLPFRRTSGLSGNFFFFGRQGSVPSNPAAYRGTGRDAFSLSHPWNHPLQSSPRCGRQFLDCLLISSLSVRGPDVSTLWARPPLFFTRGWERSFSLDLILRFYFSSSSTPSVQGLGSPRWVYLMRVCSRPPGRSINFVAVSCCLVSRFLLLLCSFSFLLF